ncbi:hypothetical protein RND81_12G066100 [Saponaria officinalis]|uniref:Transcription repressor n=1 Tax=Saponaria officinalis TaxID=3572 RepID=A0AAW1H7E3_SAPOF
MSSMFKRNLHLCFFKIKCLPTSLSPPLTLDDDEDDHNYHLHTINNDFSTPSSTTFTTTTATTSFSSLSTTATMSTDDHNCHPPDFSTVFASQRFFVSSPGCSNSILDSCTTASPTKDVDTKIVGGGVPVKKDSPDPYSDFRRSMLEMIEARESDKHRTGGVRDNDKDDNNGDLREWEFLQELLLCYLNLNPKHTHKFIIGAFSDVLVSMLSPL